MLTRRRLVASLLAVAGGGAVAALGRLAWARWRRGAPSGTEILDLADSLPEAAREIGESYLYELRTRPDRRALARAIADDLAALGRAGLLDVREPLEMIAAAVRADFTAGRSTVVDGWVLARSEARLFALKALQAQGEVQ